MPNNEPEFIDADELYYLNIEHPKMIIEGILTDGLAIMAGDSKIGKSWMTLWLCLQISTGQPVWGLPTMQADVIYFALEDPYWRVQERLHKLTEHPPSTLHISRKSLKLGDGLEEQLEHALRKYPDTGIIFIDTLQMIRDNVSGKVNAYAQDYKDLSILKAFADDHHICIFLVHHTRKEKDSENVFNNMTGSTGLLGVSDTMMVLKKDGQFSNKAALYITGRDVESMELKLQMEKNIWTATESKRAEELKKEAVPQFIYRLSAHILLNGPIEGTMTEIVETVGETEVKPSTASRLVAEYYGDVMEPLGIHYDYKRTSAARIFSFYADHYNYENDANDGNDGEKENDSKPSETCFFETVADDTSSLPGMTSQASQPSSSAEWIETNEPETEPSKRDDESVT